MIKKIKRHIVCALLFVPLFFAASCKKDNSIILDTEQIDRWVYNTMKDSYLWSAEMPSFESTDASLSPPSYFDSELRYRKTSGDLSTDIYGDRFSKIVSKSSSSSTSAYVPYHSDIYAATDRESGFGFEYRLFILDPFTISFVQVIYVMKDSPAYKAGLKRGETFREINSEVMPISRTRFSEFMTHNSITLKSSTGRTIELTRAEYDDNPILMDSIYESSHTGYIVYNHFTAGTKSQYATKLQDVFRRFKNKGVRNLILDLRYNGGGELSSSRRLASLITGDNRLGTKLLYLEENRSFGKPVDFAPEYFMTSKDIGGCNIDAERVFILTSSNTASASELVIHAMRAFYGSNLVHIGEKTLGKNLGSTTISNKRYEWELHPITIRIYDVNKVSGYEAGISPDIRATELKTGGAIGDFGDINREPLLNAAMHMISPGTVSLQATPQVYSPLDASVTTLPLSLPERGLEADN